MRVAILSRNRNLHSMRRLLKEARKAGIQCDVIDPLECLLMVEGKRKCLINVGQRSIKDYDAVIPRIGASITEYGLAVVRQFEAMSVFSVNSSEAIAQSRNKLRAIQVMARAGIRVPNTVLLKNPRFLKMAVESVGGMPVVLKRLQGTQGLGVMLIYTPITLGSVIETLQGMNEDVIIQQFIAEGAGRDYRAFVIGDHVIAAMMRTAPEGEFRTNIHRGGEGTFVKLPRTYEMAAVKACKAMGLEIAGVDLMVSRKGPVVIEVNSSPGFEGIERATDMNIAGAVIAHVQKLIRQRKQPKKQQRQQRRSKR